MTRLGTWLAVRPTTLLTSTDIERSVNMYNMVLDKPTDIEIIRDSGPKLDPQTVRIEYLEQAFTQRGTQINETSRQGVVILAQKNHPTVPDVDIRRGDQFFLSDLDLMFEIVQVDFTNNWLFSATAIATEAN
jgi:hypothetical protein